MPNDRFQLKVVPGLNVPEQVLESLSRYVETGITSHFIEAVLANDLRESVNRGDNTNIAALADIVRYLHCYLPQVCWGSPETVAEYKDDLAKREQVVRLLIADGRGAYA